MEFKVIDSYSELCGIVANEIKELIQKKKNANICIAAGHSSLGVFEKLIALFEKKEISFSECSFTAMDEWMNMNEHDSGSCSDFLRTHFLSKVDFKEENISLVDGRKTPCEDEIERIKDFISSRGGIDYMVLGVGMNGHLALNEPGVDFHSTVHATTLDSVTQKVGTKYFKDAPVLTGGLTIGIKDICDTRRLVLVVNGEKKADIVKRILSSPVTEQIPATVLKTLDHCTILCDKEAASKI